MKRNYVLFGVVLAMVLNVFTNSCRSDDEEKFPNSKSKKIKEITLEYISNGGALYYYSAFPSYNAKNQLDNITYTDEKNGGYIKMDYDKGIIYNNDKELIAFELNNKGFIKSIAPNKMYYSREKKDDDEYKKYIRYFEYDENGYLINEKFYYNGKYYNLTNYKYLNGNLITAEFQYFLNNEYKITHSLNFLYSDELNINNTPAILYSFGSYGMGLSNEKYFNIIQKGQGLYRDEMLVQAILYYAGLFGKSSRNLCKYCSENYYSDGDNWSATFKNSYDEKGNLTKITNLRTKNSYSWNFVY